MNALKRLRRFWILPVAAIAWELLTRAVGSAFFPPPTQIMVRMHKDWFSGAPGHAFLTDQATENLLPSLGRLLSGWALACVVGVALGVAAGRSAKLTDVIAPIVHFFRAIPPPTLVPVFIALFSIGLQMQVSTIAFGVVWPVLLNSIDGAREVDRLQLDTAEVFRLPRPVRLLRILLPAAAPKIFAGLRLSLSTALIVMVIAEWVGSTNGIGFMQNLAQGTSDLPGVWECVVLLGLLGWLLNGIFLAVERRVLAWHYGARRLRG